MTGLEAIVRTVVAAAWLFVRGAPAYQHVRLGEPVGAVAAGLVLVAPLLLGFVWLLDRVVDRGVPRPAIGTGT